MVNSKVVFDIISQSQDSFLIKIQFLASFLLHYIGKFCGLNINFFPEMKIKLESSTFITRARTIDFWMVWRDYEKEIIRELNKIKDQGTFIDIGANIGRYSVLMVKRGWRVYAFEPVKSNFEMLKKHVKINKAEKNVKLFNFALGSKKEKKKIYFESHKHGEASISMKNKNSLSEEIYIEKLDNIIHNKRMKNPLIMKVDVEGFEYEVLLGAEKLIKKHKPFIIIEIWNKKTTPFLKKLGYKQKGEIWYPFNG